MKAIYCGRVFYLGDNLNVAELWDEDRLVLTVDYGDPHLVVDPTDGDLAETDDETYGGRS